MQRTSGGHTDWGAAVVTPVGDENTLSVIIYVSTDHGAWKYALVGALNALAHRQIRKDMPCTPAEEVSPPSAPEASPMS